MRHGNFLERRKGEVHAGAKVRLEPVRSGLAPRGVNTVLAGAHSSSQGNNTAHAIVNPPKAALASPTTQPLPSKGNPRMLSATATSSPKSKKNEPITATTIRMVAAFLSEKPE